MQILILLQANENKMRITLKSHALQLLMVFFIAALLMPILALMPWEDTKEIDKATLDIWSAPYRGWYYFPEPIIPSDFTIPGNEKFQSFDVPTVYQIPWSTREKFMSFIGYNGQGYNSFVSRVLIFCIGLIQNWQWVSARKVNLILVVV